METGKTGEFFAENLKTGERFKIGKVIDFEMQDETADQWKHGGDCNKCRRKKYCGTPCRASGERREALMRKAFTDAFMKVLKGK